MDTTHTQQQEKIYNSIPNVISNNETPSMNLAMKKVPTINKFIQFMKLKGLSDGTIEQYSRYFNLFPHDNLNQENVNDFIMEHLGSRISRAFVNNYLEFLNNKDITVMKITGRKKKRMMEKIDDESIDVMRYALYKINHKYGLMFDLTIDGALRKDELLKLTANNFEWDIWSKDITKPCRLRIIGKGNKERVVLISPKVMEGIKKFLAERLKNKEITMNTKLWGMKHHRWWQVLTIVSKELLGRNIHPHLLRHYRSNQLYETNQFDLIDLQNFLGHSSVATTELYLHPDKEKSIKKFEKFIMDEKEKNKSDTG